jgi:hypothetical protein
MLADPPEAGCPHALGCSKVKVGSSNNISLFRILMCGHGDTPCQAKLVCGCGHTAAHACHRCGIVGTKRAPNGEKLPAVTFAGAFEPAPCRNVGHKGFKDSTIPYSHHLDDGKLTLDREGASRILTTDAMYDMRANAAENASAEEHAKFEAWHSDGNAHDASSSLAITVSDIMQRVLWQRAHHKLCMHSRLHMDGVQDFIHVHTTCRVCAAIDLMRFANRMQCMLSDKCCATMAH